MTLNEYQQAAARTCPDLGSLKLNIAHMIMGMFSEDNEVSDAMSDSVNLGEELTDIQWYLANWARLRGIAYDVLGIIVIPTPDFDDASFLFEAHFNAVRYNMSKLCDLEKKFIAYNKNVTIAELKVYAIRVFANLDVCYRITVIGADRCRQNNIDKLKKRYPEKFSEEAALNRDLDAERKELEK